MSAKKVSDRVAKRRLLQLAELLESPAVEKHFNFSHWGVSSVTPENCPLAEAEACGTTACALGWAPALPFAKSLGITLDVTSEAGNLGGTFRRNGREIGPDYVARLLFGLNRGQSDMLFYPGSSPIGNLYGDATPRLVAENIRKFVQVRFG